MPVLQIQLFGEFCLRYGAEPLHALPQPRQRTLLAYLLLHRHAPQVRRQLAFLFWPDSTEAQAHANLRQLLHRLQRALPAATDFLYLDAQTVQWRPTAPFTLDVAEFECQLRRAEEAIHREDRSAARLAMQRAVAWYGGDLLPDCYDEWVLAERERWREQYSKALEQLIVLLEAERDYAAAITAAQSLLRHDPLHETTYRCLMRLHALKGDRAGALRLYHTCATILQRELNVEPSAQTRTVYESLLHMDIAPAPPAPPTPVYVVREQLVGRQPEWQTLLRAWRVAAGGRAHLVVIAGEAGIGKSRLAEELLTWAGRQGICTAQSRAYAAEGALAYGPVAEWLRSAPVRAGWQRLEAVWLTELARIFPELLVEKPDLPPPPPMTESWQRRQLFEALARASLANSQPLLLVLDDLQWCDRETLEWLHYLLRYAPQAPLLLVGTVRPEEVNHEHPLTALLLDLRRGGQVTELDLGPLNKDETAALSAQVAGQTLVPNVEARIYQETEGNPLFIVETVRAQGQRVETGELAAGGLEAQPAAQSLVSSLQSPVSTLQSLPPKVQAVIQQRLGQLSPTAREIAGLAAVIGRSFTFQVLAQASDLGEDVLVRGLDELWQRRIVREQGVDGYDFSHDRIRDVAYASLGPVQRRHWHDRLAATLQRAYMSDLDPISAALALHHEQAGNVEQAIYWYQQAAGADVRRFAYASAIASLYTALRLLKSLSPSVEHKRQELAILLAIASNLVIVEGFATSAIAEVYHQIEGLITYIADDFLYFDIIRKLRLFYSASGDMQQSQKYAQQQLDIAQRLEAPEFQRFAHIANGVVNLQLGRFVFAKNHFLQAEPFSNDLLAIDQEVAISYRPSANGVTALPLTLWLLGYPDQAVTKMDQLLCIVEDSLVPFDIAIAQFFGSLLYLPMREIKRAAGAAARLFALHTQYGIRFAELIGTVAQGWLEAETGDIQGGLTQMRAGIDGFKPVNQTMYQTHWLGLLAETQLKAGQWVAARATLDEAFAMSESSGQRSWDADLYRLQGELLMATGPSATEAVLAYERAIQLARQQDAKSLELRATLGLSRLWQRQGRRAEAHDLLAAIYGWFTEGFDTVDLQEAKALLVALA
ncbi:MAG: AAA family ATPase [Caldilineaceae bacterium]